MAKQDIILQKLRSDPDEAVQLLYKHYFGRLCLIAYHHLGSAHDAEDMVQDLFFEIWKRRPMMNVHTSLEAYLIQSLLYKIGAFRKAKLKQSGNWEPGRQILPDEILQASDLKRAVDEILESMPERKKQCFLLSRDKQLTHSQIAGQLGISPRTVEGHIGEALRLLREKLKAFYSLLF